MIPPDEERAHVRSLIDDAKAENSPTEHKHNPGPCPVCGGIAGRNLTYEVRQQLLAEMRAERGVA